MKSDYLCHVYSEDLIWMNYKWQTSDMCKFHTALVWFQTHVAKHFSKSEKKSDLAHFFWENLLALRNFQNGQVQGIQIHRNMFCSMCLKSIWSGVAFRSFEDVSIKLQRVIELYCGFLGMVWSVTTLLRNPVLRNIEIEFQDTYIRLWQVQVTEFKKFKL